MSPYPPFCETLTVEFKSDHSKLPDDDLVEALVCLANAEGGELWLGVEDDSAATGLHADSGRAVERVDRLDRAPLPQG